MRDTLNCTHCGHTLLRHGAFGCVAQVRLVPVPRSFPLQESRVRWCDCPHDAHATRISADSR